MKKLLCLLVVSRASATTVVNMDTSQEIPCKKKKINNHNRNYKNDRNKVDRRNSNKENDRKPFLYNYCKKYSCHFCKKEGHVAKDCFKKKCDEKQKGESTNAAQDNDNKVGFVMLGLDDPENINGMPTTQ
jgi:Ni/Co efflux regulator RcnB